MTDQAVGFLLEFRNEASEELRKAHDDFTAASKALEDAVDAAQAAFVFLEEGSGKLAGLVTAAIDAVAGKSSELRTSLQSLGDIEVKAPDVSPVEESLKALDDIEIKPPDVDPIEEALKSLGDKISEPVDSGLDSVTDAVDSLNDDIHDLQGPEFEQWQAFQEEAHAAKQAVDDVVASTEGVDSAAGAYVRTLHDIGDAGMISRNMLRKSFEGLDASLSKVGRTVYEELVPGMEKFGDRGKVAAAKLAGDTVDAYKRLQTSAEEFFAENAEAFAKATDAASVWDGFFSAEDEDIRKVQDLLRVADKATLEPLVKNLVSQLGDAALAEEFWKPIAANKNVDREFFSKLRKQFTSEKRAYQTWWDKMSSTAQKFFWPVYQKQGERASKGITEFLGEKLKEVFESPIGQFTAAIQLSKLIDRVFGPALDMLSEIIGDALLPFMRVLVDFMEESIRPAFDAVTQSLSPFIESIGLVLRSIGDGLLPLFESMGSVLRAFMPVISLMARVLSIYLNVQFEVLGVVLSSVATALEWVFSVLSYGLDVVISILKPLEGLYNWLDSTIGVSEILGYTLSVLLIPAVLAYAATAIPAATVATIKFIGSLKDKIKTTKDDILTTWAAGASMLGLKGSLLDNVKALGSWIKMGWSSVVVFVSGIIPSLMSATTAAWAFAAALLANPITWIVLGVAAAIGLLTWAVYELWEPISRVAAAFWDWLSPISDMISEAVDWCVYLGTAVLSLLDPFGILTGTLSLVGELFSWIFGSSEEASSTFSLGWLTDSVKWLSDWMFGWFDYIPGWMKWLLGLDDSQQIDTEGVSKAGADEAVAMVEGAQEGAVSSVNNQPDWWLSMWGVQPESGLNPTDAVVDAAVQSAEAVGESTSSTFVGTGGMFQTLSASGVGAAETLMGSFTDTLLTVASKFPLDDLFSSLLGPYTSITPQPATAVAPSIVSPEVSIGRLEYEVESETTGDGISSPIVKAIQRQTEVLASVIRSINDGGLDLDLETLRSVTEF